MNTFAKVLSKWEKIALTYVSVAAPVVAVAESVPADP